MAAIWLIRKNSSQSTSFPVAVCCDPHQPVIKARLYGERTWRPMREALLALTALHGEQALVPAGAAAEFIADVIEQLGNLDGPTLLISLAQNTRGVWRNTANTNIRVDNLGTVPQVYVPASIHSCATSEPAPTSAGKPPSTTATPNAKSSTRTGPPPRPGSSGSARACGSRPPATAAPSSAPPTSR